MNLAVTPDGTVWLAEIDGPVRSITNGLVTVHSLVARQIEVTSDGSMYAIKYGPTDVPSLMKYQEGIFVEALPGPFDDIAAAPDGSLRTISALDFGGQSGIEAPAQQTLGRLANGAYTTEPIPDGFAGAEFTVAPDGALWVIGDTGEIVDRGGMSDVEWALIRYDGNDVSFLIAPFPEPNDLAVHPNRTVWVTSVHGAFAYNGEEWVQYGVEDGLSDEGANFVEVGPDGSIYIGTRLGVTRISAESD
jgi:streptogramin lyase